MDNKDFIKKFFGINSSKSKDNNYGYETKIQGSENKTQSPSGQQNKLDKLVPTIGGLLTLILLVGFFFINNKYEITSKGSKGEEVVKLLYDFRKIDDLAKQDEKVKSLLTEEVYKELTVRDAERALNTYLKFKQNPCSVEILEKRPGTIIYTLNTNSLSAGRVFIFTYDVNIWGKICYARELEGIDFK